jgi:hypothetical protein
MYHGLISYKSVGKSSAGQRVGLDLVVERGDSGVNGSNIGQDLGDGRSLSSDSASNESKGRSELHCWTIANGRWKE